MLIIRPDFERRIYLPGAGLCARPVDIDRSLTGFSRLASLRVYAFAAGATIDGEAEADEVFIVLMRGEAQIVVSSDERQPDSFSLQREGGTRVVYMPPQASYRLTTVTDCDIAYARAVPNGLKSPEARGFAMPSDRLDVIGYATGMSLTLATHHAGDSVGTAEPRPSPECLMHIRSNDAITATIAGERLDDWNSVALGYGESALLNIQTGTAEILTISACSSGSEIDSVIEN